MAGKKVENIITLQGDDSDIKVEVIEQTVIDGTTYLLVADVTDDEEDSDCYILKDVSEKNSEEANYEVLDDSESEIVFETFEKMLSKDIDLRSSDRE